MRWLNHQHLQYFREVALAGNLTTAAAQLRLAPSTLSRQIGQLEHALGSPLFERVGRSLRLTALGRIALEHAEQIDTHGRALLDAALAKQLGEARPLRLGVVPALNRAQLARIFAQITEIAPLNLLSDTSEHLWARLRAYEIDAVLLEIPLRLAQRDPDASHHCLLDEETWLWGQAAFVERLRPGFPQSLEGCPIALLSRDTAARRAFDQWTARTRVNPHVVLSAEDHAQTLATALSTDCLMLAPADPQLKRLLAPLAQLPDLRSSVWLLSLQRAIPHPSLHALLALAAPPQAASSPPGPG